MVLTITITPPPPQPAPQAACLARCNGARVESYPYGSVSLEEFRGMVAGACASGESHVIVSYSRQGLGQTGDGHFSPVGGYHEGEDLALILDTARFKYPPHWVPLPVLYRCGGRRRGAGGGGAWNCPNTQRFLPQLPHFAQKPRS